MNIAEYSIQKKTVSIVLTLVIVVWGALSYLDLGRLEDPEFTIKTALVITQYPGASPLEVEQEITDPLETAIQQMSQLDKVSSMSKKGISYIYVDIKAKYVKTELPQIWDELRRKVSDARGKLPPGAKDPIVKDDFGDVYGVFFAVSGEGYSLREVKAYADFLKKELLLVKDVAKVDIWGDQIEAVYVEISRAKLKQMGIPLPLIFKTLNEHNAVTDAGSVKVGSEYIRLSPTGSFSSVEEIGEFLISGSPADNPVYLKDIARIRRGYMEPSLSLMRYNGKPAIGLGISTVSDGNVVTMGEAVKKRLAELEPATPVGMELGVIAYQSDTVSRAVNGFVINLVEAVAIVIGLLLIFMGLQSGMLIGLILLLTISATFIIMDLMGINLQKVSLGALILALGMLVDNAIVVTEGILIRIQTGMNRFQAAGRIVKETMWPLLGATVVAILAFAAIGASSDDTGEYCRSLFYVVMISLLISWVLAITLTPLFCNMFLKPKVTKDKDPYAGPIYQGYKKLLTGCLRFKSITIGGMALLLCLSIYGFTFVEQSFFPESPRPQFLIDYWKIQGSHIDDTSGDLMEIEKYVEGLDGVTAVTTLVGQGALRFYLTYDIQMPESSYGQLVVSVDNPDRIQDLMAHMQGYLTKHYPDAEPRLTRFALGPSCEAQIEARFSGPDPEVIKGLARQAMNLMEKESLAQCIKTNWRQKVKVVRPVYAEARARRLGITRQNLSQTMKMNFEGTIAGVYREKNKLLPIIARPPKDERGAVDQLANLQVLSPVTGQTVPFSQITTGVVTEWEDPVIRRRNRKRTITAQCDITAGNVSVLFNTLKPAIESIPLPRGYELTWGGEHENAYKAQESLFKLLPACFVAMILTIIILFNTIRQPMIIFLCLPLAVIGVTAGLLLTGHPFGFMSLLGFLSLAGMLVKNAIVLIDQIDLSIREGEDFYHAVVNSSISRVRPVLMAAMTTVLGMIPLLFDTLFAAMAVTIMFGLTFGTVLTLFVVPVLYMMLVPPPQQPND